MTRLCVTIVAVGCACAGASADTVFNTIPTWDGSRSNGWLSVAQTFTAPAGDTTLSTWEQGIGGDGGTYTVGLYRWDRANERATGSALFTRAAESIPQSVTFVEFPVGVNLVAGTEYAMITTLSSGEGNGLAFSGNNHFDLGYANFTFDSIFDRWAFTQNDPYDLAFRAVFVPAPASAGLLGLAGLVAARRRR